VERVKSTPFFIRSVLRADINFIVNRTDGAYFEHPMTAAQVIILSEALREKTIEDDFIDEDRLRNITSDPFGGTL